MAVLDVIRWIVCIPFIVIALPFCIVNLWIAYESYILKRHTGSMLPLFGGLAAAMAVAIIPLDVSLLTRFLLALGALALDVSIVMLIVACFTVSGLFKELLKEPLKSLVNLIMGHESPFKYDNGLGMPPPRDRADS